MPVRHTVQLGDPVIRLRAQEVADPVSPETQAIVQDLIDSMRADNLVGMAAPQIGESVRVIVTEIRSTIYREKSPEEFDAARVFINPEITHVSEKLVPDREGCGSVARAGIFADVPRPESVTVRAFDQKGESFELEADGLLARIIQHEVDHLDGVVFLDRVTDMRTLIGRDAVIAAQKKG